MSAPIPKKKDGGRYHMANLAWISLPALASGVSGNTGASQRCINGGLVRGLVITQRTVTHLMHRYEELVALRITQISDSIKRGPRKKRFPPALKQLLQRLDKGLQVTAALWPPLEHAYRFLDQAKAILANESQGSSQQIQEQYLAHLAQMRDDLAALGPLAEAFEHFCHITDNFAAGLFQCYDITGLPRTNNDLEHCFGVAHVHERRATGRRGAIPGVVVRGSVRVMAAVTSQQQVFSVEDRSPKDYQRWRDLRRPLRQREEARRQQWRFGKHPAAYLATIEARLLQ